MSYMNRRALAMEHCDLWMPWIIRYSNEITQDYVGDVPSEIRNDRCLPLCRRTNMDRQKISTHNSNICASPLLLSTLVRGYTDPFLFSNRFTLVATGWWMNPTTKLPNPTSQQPINQIHHPKSRFLTEKRKKNTIPESQTQTRPAPAAKAQAKHTRARESETEGNQTKKNSNHRLPPSLWPPLPLLRGRPRREPATLRPLTASDHPPPPACFRSPPPSLPPAGPRDRPPARFPSRQRRI